MPVVNINIFKGRSVEEKKDICLTIQKAIKETYNITHDNFHHRINEYDDTAMFIPPNRSKNYIFIELDFMPGRSKAEKNELYDTLANKLQIFNIKKEDMLIIMREPLLENWYIRGQTGDEIVQKNK
jgi:phenylpyruvate tautomerase PptA (4-oxalocrotonate tautomerase family)